MHAWGQKFISTHSYTLYLRTQSRRLMCLLACLPRTYAHAQSSWSGARRYAAGSVDGGLAVAHYCLLSKQHQPTMRVILSAQHLHDKRKVGSRWKLSADTDVTIQPVCRDALRDCLTGGCCARGQRDRKNKVQSVNLDPRACAAAAVGGGMPCASARATPTRITPPEPKQ
ncbi:uncharacterized protein BKA78DRAFT_126316 [Phyllosticta capitalensis]|uniref:uncharacterized protein n=1 Tax=Phyllosticta capitalensis TaxID=121624 RepID=UPI0031319B5A